MTKINLYINGVFECEIPMEDKDLDFTLVFDQIANAYEHCNQVRISDTELVVDMAEGYKVTYKAA